MNSNLKDKNRDNCVKKINSVVDDINLARNIEKSIYNFTINFSKENNINRRWDNKIFYNLYFSKIRSIYSNLNSETYINNNYLLDKIKSKEIKAEDISKLSVYEIHPDNWKELIDNKIKRDRMKFDIKPESMTDRYKCRKCGSRKCSYYEMQTRSADEPMTQFFTCLDCKNKWKM
jgi:transcription elongation factor S-II